MKTTAALAALMAAGAMAQPHARHAHQQHHRALVKRLTTEVVWEYVTTTVTTTIDGPIATTMPPSPPVEEPQVPPPPPPPPPSDSPPAPSPEEENPAEPSANPAPPPPAEQPQPSPDVEPTPSPEAPPPPPPPAPEQPSPPADDEDDNGGSGGGGGGIGGGDYSGFITYYDIGLGACGWNDGGKAPTGSQGDPMIVAISRNVYFAGVANPNNMELCGKTIVMESPDNPGVVRYGVIRDACEACTTAGDLDVNIEGMGQFYSDPVFVGKGKITWKFA